MEMHWPKLFIFFWLSINYASIFPIILSLSHAATPPPRAIVVKCDGSVYDVDVDVDVFSIVSLFVYSLKFQHSLEAHT